MRWKIFQWVKFLFRGSSNLRKLSRQKFYNELACVFTAYDTSKNADWNQQQLTDGGILANWNSANYPYCFLSNQKKVQILAFLHVIRQRNVSCPLPVRDIKDNRERAWSQAKAKIERLTRKWKTRENISAWSGKREQWREKRSSSSPQFPLVLFSCLRLFYFAEPTIWEPGTGHLFPSLWPQGDDGNFLKQTLIKHQTLF